MDINIGRQVPLYVEGNRQREMEQSLVHFGNWVSKACYGGQKLLLFETDKTFKRKKVIITFLVAK